MFLAFKIHWELLQAKLRIKASKKTPLNCAYIYMLHNITKSVRISDRSTEYGHQHLASYFNVISE